LKEKVVITGGAGFIGSKLGYELNKKGYEVLLLDDLSFGYEENLTIDGSTFGTFKKIDIRSPDLKNYFLDADYIFHFASINTLPVCQSQPTYAIDVNVTGIANVLEASRLSNVKRIIFASTGAVYENNTKFPCVEEDPINPNLVYSMSKSFCEKLCNSYSQLYGMEVCITRYYNVYGPHQDVKRTSPAIVAYIIKELLQNKKPILHSNGEQQRDYVYIDDVNELNLLCMTHPNAKDQIFNVSSGIATSVNQIYNIVASNLNSNIKPIFRDSKKIWDKYPSLFDRKYHLNEKRIEEETEKFTLGNVEKAEKLIGWKATTSIEEGLSKTIEYAKKTLSK
tara:strand:+ start:94 stop:1104 length:1011 start_codon:yes stop_codon:yes gene_type:complete